VAWQSGHTKYAALAEQSIVDPVAPQVGHAEMGRTPDGVALFRCHTTFCLTLDLGFWVCRVGAMSPAAAKIVREDVRVNYCRAIRRLEGTLETESVKLARLLDYRTQPCGPVQPSRVTSSITSC
jgi:hypothetical protein